MVYLYVTSYRSINYLNIYYMLLTTRTLILLLLLELLKVPLYSNNGPEVLSQNTPRLYFSFDDCVSFAGASSQDYSEFTAESFNFSECSGIETSFPDHVFRGQNFPHSCTPGINNSAGMCIEGSNNCVYDPGNNASLKFNVRVIPGANGIGSLEKLTFFEKGPEQFENIGGVSGLNNYPTQLGIRVLVDNVEIFQSIMETSRDWTLREVDFSSNGAFTVTGTTEFKIELLPFCPVGNAGLKQVWDIDELNVIGGCNNINAGIISSQDDLTICNSDSGSDVIEFDVTNAFGSNASWIVSTLSGDILLIQESELIDFSSFPAGTYNVNNLIFESDVTGLMVGNNIADLTGCFDFSNTVSVTNSVLVGGTLTDDDGFIDAYICSEDSTENIITTNLTGAEGTFINYLLADNDDIIIESLQGPVIDFNNLGEGTYRVYAAIHDGQLLNAVAGVSIDDIAGCFELSSPLRVIKELIEVGTISFNGQTNIQLCGAEGMSLTPLVNGPSATNGQYIVSVPNGRILNVFNSLPIDITDFNNPIIEIRLISFIGRIDDLMINGNVNNLGGCFLLSNPIIISNEDIDGGNLSSGGETEISICLNDGTNNNFTVDLIDNVGDSSIFLVTDLSNNILETSLNNTFSGTGSGSGTFLVYNLSLINGLTGVEVGNSPDDFMGCFDLSNAITVTQSQVSAGMITDGNGDTSLTICSGDDSSDVVNVIVGNASSPLSYFVVTEVDGTILESGTDNNFDFEGVPSGECLIYHIASLEELDIDNIQNIDDIEGCTDISNSISVIRIEVAGGSLVATDGTSCVTLVTGDATIDSVSVTLIDAIGDNMQWLITNVDGEIIQLPSDQPFALEGIADSLFIQNISSAGLLSGLIVGQNISDISGCFSLSDSVKVVQQTLNGGVLMTTDGLTLVSACLGDGVDDIIDVSLADNQGPLFSYIITDDAGEILALPMAPPFDLTNAGNGTCFIYNISYVAGIMGLEVGDNLSDISGTFALSNSVTVNRSEVAGGSISANVNDMGVGTEFSICSGDGEPDSLNLSLIDNIGLQSQWIITDTSDVVIMFSDDAPQDFEGVPTGECYIYHLSSLPGLTGLAVGDNLSALEGCFALSNFVSIIRNEVSGGTLALADGTTIDTIIVGDSVSDIVDVTLADNVGDTSLFVFTDTLGNITLLPDGDIDLDTFDQGICLLYNLSSVEDVTGLTVGENISMIAGCYDFSNPITYVKSIISGGTIATLQGEVNSSFCLSDLMSDTLFTTLIDNAASNFSWIVTDEDSVILGLPIGPNIDFAGTGAGVCSVYHIGFEDNLMGLAVGSNLNDLTGSFALSNSITVTRDEVISGTLLTTDNESEVTVMVDDGIADSIDVVAPIVMGADTSLWLITDTTGVIVDLPMSPPFDFENAGSGVCQIWYLSYIEPFAGLAVGTNVSDLSGCFALSTPVTVTRQGLMGGTLMTSDGLTSLSICAGDGIADPFDVVLTDTIGPLFSWVITDDNGEILGLPASPPFDLEDAGVGTCQVYNLSYASNLTGLAVGENINDFTGNFDLSNPITVFRSLSVGGMITTTDGDTITSITVGDNFPELVGVSVTGASGINMTWIITDTLGNIVELPMGPPFNFEDAGQGVCEIWSLSHGDGTTGIEIDNNLTDIEGCTELSNSIRVIRDSLIIESGTIVFSDNSTEVSICTGDGVMDPLDIVLSGNDGPNFRYIITDTAGEILGLPPGGGMNTTINLEQSGGGVARIYHLAHANGLTGLNIGNNLTDLMGTFELSDFLIVNRSAVDGGEATLPDGTELITIMVGDGVPDSIDVNVVNTEGDTMYWLITDNMGLILAQPDTLPFDFESSGTGLCNIYNLSTNGVVTGIEVDENISDLSGCFELSNPVAVVRLGLNGGTLSFLDGGTTAGVCYNGMDVDSIDVILEDNNGSSQSYIITDDQGIILGLPSMPPFDFSNAGLGDCNIYNIAFDQGLVGLEVDSSLNDLVGMFSLSNPITVTRSEAEAGMIMTLDSLVMDSLVVNDMMPDTIQIVVTDTIFGDIQQYIVTDPAGTIEEIVALQDTTDFIFESQGGGICNIWLLSNDASLSGLTVGNNVSDLDGCFDLSNPVSIFKDGINGGFLTTTDSLTTIDVCSGDGVDDFVDFILIDTSGTNHDLILTSNGIILAPSVLPPFNFEVIAGGLTEFQFYNIAYEDDLTGLNTGLQLSNLSGTFDLSNPVTVNRDLNAAGTIFGNNSTSLTIIVGEGINDTVFMNVPIVNGDTSTWVILNTSNDIIDLPGEPPFLFEDSAADTCIIQLVAYSEGLQGLNIGSSIDSLEGCFALSNPVEVAKKELNGGTLTTVGGDTMAQFCVGDGVADILEVVLVDTLGQGQNYIVVDSMGTILQVLDNGDFNFEGTGAGMCSVYSIVFTGPISGLTAGDALSDIQGCFLLSNSIEVDRISVIGGNVSLDSGGTTALLCTNDNMDETLTFETTSTASPYVYIVTDTFDIIDTVLTTNSFTFSDTLSGACRVWGVSYTGNFIAVPGDTLFIDMLSSECADISGNAITVTKEVCPGMPVINEITSAGMVELTNIGVDTVDLVGYQLCNNGVYQVLADADVNCGELLLAPGEFVTVNLTNISIDTLDGEMALYIDGNFGSNQSIVDYVQWGSTMHLRTNIAIGAGIWTAGDAVAAFSAPNSLLYDGDGDASTDWSEGLTGLCTANFNGPQDPQEFAYRLYPVPSSEMITVELMEPSTDPVSIQIYDSNSRMISNLEQSNKVKTDISLDQFTEGIYYMRVTVGRKTLTKKFLVIK